MARKGENIYKRKDGRWEGRYIAFYDENGKPRYKSFYAKTYTDAKRKKQELCAAKKAPQCQAEESTGMLVEEICWRWLQEIRQDVKEASYVKYRNVLEVYVIPALGDCDIGSISIKEWEQFFLGLLQHGKTDDTGLAPKSVSDIKSIVKMMQIYAVKEGYLHECRVDAIRIKQTGAPIRTLSKDEQRKLEQFLLQELSDVHLGIYLALYTGIRLGELCALRWEDIDTESKLISIKKTLIRLKDYTAGSKEKKTKLTESTPKSRCSMRDIPIPDFLLKLLLAKSAGIPHSAYLLTGCLEKFIEPRLMEYYFKKAIAACGIQDANFHCLRHTFATRCVELGVDIKTLSEILGHADIRITMNRYVHPSMDLKRMGMEKLGNVSMLS